MIFLPKFLNKKSCPAIHDFESLTVMEQTARLYGAMSAFFDEYNNAVEAVNDNIATFMETEQAARATFENNITKVMRQFICQMKAENDLASAPRIADVFLSAENWTSIGDMHFQVVQIDSVTENTQVDLKPSIEQLAIFYNKNLTFVAENDNGVVTVYAIGQKPQNDYTIQATLREVRT